MSVDPFREIISLNCPNTTSQTFYLIANWLGIVGNSLLLATIYYTKSTDLQQYSFILRASCIVDIFSSLAQFLTQTRPEIVGENMLIFGLDGVAARFLAETSWFQGRRLSYIMLPEFIGCIYSVCFCWIPFGYRYALICWQVFKKLQASKY